MSKTLNEQMAGQLQRQAIAFFYKQAGYNWDEAHGETKEQGRMRCAKGLAKAEAWADKLGVEFEWEQDDTTNEEWEGKEGAPFYYTWRCLARLGGNAVASLCGIDFGRKNDPTMNEQCRAYKRVVEAELALEAMGNITD